MKLLKNICGVILVLMISVITFFAWNLIFTFVGNHASITHVEPSGLPMIILMIELYVVLFGVFNYAVLKRRDAYMFRKYAFVVGGFALAGVVTSVLCGTLVYHTFFGDYIFFAYPLVMLVVHVAFLCVSTYVAILSLKLIHKDHPQKTFRR